ncbi:MAG: ATP-binding protein [Verrucomicrobiota bacterium]|jgi:hypothetical protein
MSSTRTAKDNSVFHQARYASSPEFERGLIANLVAKRCALLDDKADRELIWFIQYLSHQAGGLAAVADDLIKNFSHRLGPPAMVKIGKLVGKTYTTDEVLKIRPEIPRELRGKYPLRGEIDREILRRHNDYQLLAERARMALQYDGCENSNDVRYCERQIQKAEDAAAEKTRNAELAKKHPTSYPVATFHDLCRLTAENGDGTNSCSLEKMLCRLCLDPACDLQVGPWYFSDLLNVLREYHRQWIQEKSKSVVTTLGKKVCDALDYTLHSRSLSLLEGNPRLGKSFSARVWCEQHPGKARFIEVPPGNDDATFLRALARGLGLGNFLNYKVVEIRERVEFVLLTGDILLVLDEAQRLWPQRNLRYGFPGRINWLMAMANRNVPVCAIATPQFIQAQKAIEKTGWNSAQLTGRIGYYEFLPTELETSDLIAVSRAVLPEASEEVLKALAIYARASARYLAAVGAIAKRAQYTAQRNGRAHCSTEDVRTAMKESVIPSDTMLVRTLEQAQKPPRRGRELPPVPVQAQVETPEREIMPERQWGFHRRAGDPAELLKG